MDQHGDESMGSSYLGLPDRDRDLDRPKPSLAQLEDYDVRARRSRARSASLSCVKSKNDDVKSWHSIVGYR